MYSKSTPEQTDYLLILRGLAALGVLLGHAFGIGQYSVGAYISDSTTGVFQLFNHPLTPLKEFLFIVTPLLGSNFVILFFVQSGYLMGKIFQDDRYKFSAESVRHFYRNRILRLVPLLYFNLLIAACFFVNAQFSPKMVIGDLLFITNFTGRGLNLVTWSLSHEMQYYLIAPLVFWLFRSPRRSMLLWLLATICGVYLATRSGFLAHFEYVFAFLSGYSINILLRLYPLKVKERTKIAVVLLCIGLVDVAYNWLFLIGHFQYGDLVVTLVTAAAVFVVECGSSYEISQRHPRFAAVIRFGMFTGALSYGIYLWHYMVVISRASFFTHIADRFALKSGLSATWEHIALYHVIEISLTLVVTYALATATFYGIETRFRPGLYRSAASVRRSVAVEQPAE